MKLDDPKVPEFSERQKKALAEFSLQAAVHHLKQLQGMIGETLGHVGVVSNELSRLPESPEIGEDVAALYDTLAEARDCTRLILLAVVERYQKGDGPTIQVPVPQLGRDPGRGQAH